MYYDQDFVDSLVVQIKLEPEAYLKRVATGLSGSLVKQRNLYKTFGVYWWAVKDALRKYGKKGWFTGIHDDLLMKERAWHGDLFKTVVAALYYHGKQMAPSDDHEWRDKNDVDHDYSLFDPDAGF